MSDATSGPIDRRTLAEIDKLQAETRKLIQESDKLRAEQLKMMRETTWYPAIVIATAVAAGAAFTKPFL